MKIFEMYFIFNIDDKKRSNFEKYFDKKYSSQSMVTKIGKINISEIDFKLYNKIKYFFLLNNRDSEVISFSEKLYKKYDFDYLKVITEEDLDFLHKNEGENENQQLNTSSYFKILINSNMIPIEWNKFMVTIMTADSIVKNISDQKFIHQQVDKYLDIISDKIKNRRFDFKIYQNKYKMAKKNLLLNVFKKAFFTELKHTGPAIIKEERY
jgi:hypothetical protein